MKFLPKEIGIGSRLAEFLKDPFAVLAQARASGNLFAIDTSGPVFSRTPDCAGVVCVLGENCQREVLTNIDAFALPPSAAERLCLSERLHKLNRGLHSMKGDQHEFHKSALSAAFGAALGGDLQSQVWKAIEHANYRWSDGAPFPVLKRMRETMNNVACHVLLGDRAQSEGDLAPLVQSFFQLRREASSPHSTFSEEMRARLEAVGQELDSKLRAYVRNRKRRIVSEVGLLSHIARMAKDNGGPLTEDEVVGHMNVIFISSIEPLAVALSWILLILSQQPALQQELRSQITRQIATSNVSAAQLDGIDLLSRVVNECLRVLPPNAFMVRITAQPVSVSGVRLPRNCEVILCPFLSHRDPQWFEEPDRFLTERWTSPPTPFVYFPFGAGGHGCLGRSLALRLLKSTVAFLVRSNDLTLATDQIVDWRLNIQFTPDPDPLLQIQPANRRAHESGGVLRGPIANLIHF